MKTFFTLLFILLAGVIQQDDYRRERENMVEIQLRRRGIINPDVLEAMRRVPRHEFVPKGKRENAYEDRPVSIGYGQTISQPFIVAYMTSVIDPDKEDKILEIGTGSGYQAAVLSAIVAKVYTIEIVDELAESAKERLKRLGYENVYTFKGDGYYGLETYAPFDAIMVTAASEFIPPPLIEQLRDGGKMIIPVGSPYFTQQLVLVSKENGKIKTKNLLPVRFVPFTREK